MYHVTATDAAPPSVDDTARTAVTSTAEALMPRVFATEALKAALNTPESLFKMVYANVVVTSSGQFEQTLTPRMPAQTRAGPGPLHFEHVSTFLLPPHAPLQSTKHARERFAVHRPHLSARAGPLGTPAQSEQAFLPLHTPHLSAVPAPPHTPAQSVRQSLLAVLSHVPHLQQEKEKPWCGLVSSKKKKRRGAGS